jgi:hypothetical protein
VTKGTLSVDIVRVEFNPNGFLNNAIHISGLRVEEALCQCGVTGRYCGELRPTCLDVPVGCAVDTPLTICLWNGPSA